MTFLEKIGSDRSPRRELFVLDVEAPNELPSRLSLPSPFLCLIAWDSESAHERDLSSVSRQLLEAGAAYICAWGPGCERLHDICDEERDLLSVSSDSVVMTTWHAQESLADALWFVLTAAIPDDAYAEECLAIVGVSIGSRKWAAEIREAFRRRSDE